MKTTAGMKAVAYIRFSTDEQAASLTQQKDVIERWAKQNGVVVLDWAVDDGISGTLREDRRPGLGRILQLIRHRPDFRLVLCYDLSRFGRFQDPNTYGYYFQQAHDARKEFYFLQDSVSSKDTDIAKVILRVITAHGAAEKSRITATGAIRGQIARARRGRVVGGFPPFGFDHLVVDQAGQPSEIHRFIRRGPRGKAKASVWHILEPNGNLRKEVVGPPSKQKSEEIVLTPGSSDRIEIVKQIYHWYGIDGLGYRRIARALNQRGTPSPLGQKWTTGAVREILYNPAYRGHAVFNRISSAKIFRIRASEDGLGNDHTKVEVEDYERGMTRNNPESEWFVKRGGIKTFIQQDVLDRVDDRLPLVRVPKGGSGLEPAGRNPRMVHSPALLAGYVICSKCGRHYRGHPWRKKLAGRSPNTEEYAYVCGLFKDGGPEACRKLYVHRDLIEKPIIKWMRDRYSGRRTESAWEERIKAELRAIFIPGSSVDRHKELESQRSELKAKVAAIVQRISVDNLDLIDAELTRLRTRIGEIEAEMGKEAPVQQPDIDIDSATKEILGLVDDFRENFETASPRDRQRILRPFLGQILIDPDKRRAEVEMKKIPLPVMAGGLLMKSSTPTGI